MESIHRRIKRLRGDKKMSLEALAKRITDLSGQRISWQSVQEWEQEDGTAPSRKRQPFVAKALGVTVQELVAGSATPSVAAEPGAKYMLPREEILLLLFRGLFSHQQREYITEMRALFDANQVTRKELGQAPLKGVSNEAVRAAFKDVPPAPKRPAGKKRGNPGRDPSAAMGDYPEQ